MVLVEPGKPHGPCGETCTHGSCQQATVLARTRCHLCSQVIGWGRPFGFDYDQRAVHAQCLLAESAPVSVSPLVHTRGDVLQLLQISESTLSDLLSRRLIEHVRIGTRVMFTPQQLQNFLARHTVGRLRRVS